MKDGKESEIQTGICSSGDGEWFDKQVLKVFSDTDLKDVWKLFQDKVKDFEQSIIKEYKASDEFKWWKLNRTLHEKIAALKKQDEAKQERQRQQNYQQQFRQQYQGSSSYQQEAKTAFSSARIEISSKEAELIDKCYKAMATQVHPDKGGSLEDMQILNNLKDRLRKSK